MMNRIAIDMAKTITGPVYLGFIAQLCKVIGSVIVFYCLLELLKGLLE